MTDHDDKVCGCCGRPGCDREAGLNMCDECGTVVHDDDARCHLAGRTCECGGTWAETEVRS